MTAALLALVVAVAAFQVLMRPSIGPALKWPFFLLMAALLVAIWTEWNPYGAEKLLRFALITLPAMTAAIVLPKHGHDRSQFLTSAHVVSALIVFMALYEALSGHAGTRLTVNDANPIGLAWAASTLVLISLARISSHRRRWWLDAGLVACGVIVVILSGSRGPIMGLAAAGLVVAVRSGLSAPAALSRTFVAATGLVLGLALVVLAFAADIPARLITAASGDIGDSGADRLDRYGRALSAAASNPLGVGWGGFAAVFGLAGTDARTYPHNLFLEVWLEGGLLFLVLLVCAIVTSLRGIAAARPISWQTTSLLALVVFGLTTSQLSGDINDHRLLFIVIGWGLAEGRLARKISRLSHARMAPLRATYERARDTVADRVGTY